ncbi:MAG: VWA domain-containing protein [Pyrinomonadaceae bacterium]
MKKFAILSTILLIGISVFAQEKRQTRPRVVVTPDSSQRNGERPVLQNDTPKQTNDTPPVLDDGRSPTIPPPPPPLITAPVEDNTDVIKIETNLVTLPVTVLDRNGRFVGGISEPEFQVFDNGRQQQIEYFASVETPFTVVLLLDVSPSTRYKIEEIRMAANTFVNQLRADDKVMVIAFDESFHILARPTNDRNRLRMAIEMANFGDGTSLYDAVGSTIKTQLKNIEGRKAVVIFTDGVDTTSKFSSYESTVKQVEELDAMIYPIRYNTLADQNGGVVNVPTRSPRNTRTQSGGGSVFEQVLGAIIFGDSPVISGGGRNSDRNVPLGSTPEEYARGKQYLTDIAGYSGGRMFEADSITNLDAAFRSIAEELRMQYSVGYYPGEVGQVGERRNVMVRVKRPNLSVRTKRSYIVGSGT